MLRSQTCFIDLGVDIEAVPESLQDVPDKPRATVEKTKADEIAVEKIEERPHEQWRPGVDLLLKPTCTMHLGA